jgi:hypothetical protein
MDVSNFIENKFFFSLSLTRECDFELHILALIACFKP